MDCAPMSCGFSILAMGSNKANHGRGKARMLAPGLYISGSAERVSRTDLIAESPVQFRVPPMPEETTGFLLRK